MKTLPPAFYLCGFEWRHHSGLGARKQLAQELCYTGALDGSANMNLWLHQQVMTESGGKVPDNLKA